MHYYYLVVNVSFILFLNSYFWSHTLHCSKGLGTISKNRVESQLYLIQLDQYFWYVHNYNKCFTHIILFPLFHLYLSNISFIWGHTLHCLIGFWNKKNTPSGKWIFWLTKKKNLISPHHNKSCTNFFVFIVSLILIIYLVISFIYIFIWYHSQ